MIDIDIKTNNWPEDVRQKNSYLTYFFLVVLSLLYIFDEVLNNLIGTNAIGLTIAIICIYFIVFFKMKILKPKLIFLIITLLITLTTSMSLLNSNSCGIEAKGLFSIILMALLAIGFWEINLTRIVCNFVTCRWIMMSILILLILDMFGIGIRTLIFGKSNGAGPYSEQSHLAIYLLPLVSVQLQMNFKDKLTWAVILLTIILADSTTLLIGLLMIFVIILFQLNNRQRFTIAMISVALSYFLIINNLIDINHHINRVLGIAGKLETEAMNHLNLSALVWLNGWTQGIETFLATNFLGLGLNQMGCGSFYSVGVFSPQMLDSFGVVLNAHDGSMLAPKLIAELGILGFIILLVVVTKSIVAIFEFIKNTHNSNFDERFFKIVRCTGGLMLIIYLFVRGLGYFQLPVLLAISMLFVPKSLCRQHSTNIDTKAK